MDAQNKAVWNGRTCAVSLTYDDALNVHIDNAVPLLDSLGLRATFYLSGFFPSFRERVIDWKRVAAKGHELGNHTLFHPCTGNIPGREWVKPDYDLGKYTMQRLVDEITMANTLLTAIDSQTTRTFAYPCGETKIGDSSYADRIRNLFPAARGVDGKIQKMEEIDLSNVGSYMISGETGEELIALVKKAMKERALVVFLFHGVGGEHNLNVSLPAHRQLLEYLSKNEKEIWIAPMREIGEYISANRSSKN